MENTKIAVIYYSSTGVNTQMARWAAEAVKATGAEVRLLQVQELAPEAVIDGNPAWRENVEATKDIAFATSEDLDWADGYIFASPSRFGTMASQMKQFFDIQGGPWSQGKMANKAVTAMASAGNMHGGQELVIQNIYTVMQHWGSIIVPTGYVNPTGYPAGGNPYGTSATVDGEGNIVNADAVQAAVEDQAKRLTGIATKLK